MHKHKRECRRLCDSAGLTVSHIEHRGNGHIALHTDRGILFCAGTPSDRRWRLNMLAQARRLGLG